MILSRSASRALMLIFTTNVLLHACGPRQIIMCVYQVIYQASDLALYALSRIPQASSYETPDLTRRRAASAPHPRPHA